MPTATRYRDLAEPISVIARDLSQGRLAYDQPCHLDPDIDGEALRGIRPEGWRGALGQVSASLAHLRNMGVGPNDVFLFWGLFRACECRSTGWHYFGPRQHLIFGWLQVERVLDLGSDGTHALTLYPWLAQHPHARPGWVANNSIFIARQFLSIDDAIPGYGVWDRPIMLTAERAPSPSLWNVPPWLDPTCGGVGMSYHPRNRWLGSGRVMAAARGQEFIADAGDRTDARQWLLSLFGEDRCVSGLT
jgi:hypothetical protein